MFTYLQNRIATEGGNPGPIPRSNEAPAEWDGQFWDQAKLQALAKAQTPGGDGRQVANDQTWMQALNPLSGLTKAGQMQIGYGPNTGGGIGEYGEPLLETQGEAVFGDYYTDKLGRKYKTVPGAEGDPNTYIQFIDKNGAGFQNAAGSGRDRVAPIYKLNPDGTATPHSANTSYREGQWSRDGQEIATWAAIMATAGIGGAAIEAGAAGAGSGAGGSAAYGGGGVAGASGGSGSAIGADLGAYIGAAEGGAGAGTAAGAGGTGLTAAQTAYGGLEAGGAAAGMGGNATAAGTFGTAGASSGAGAAAGSSLINGVSNQSLASGAASIGSAYLQDRATDRAINAQTNAANSSNALQLAQYNQTRQDNAPWRAAGENALGKLTALLNDGSLTSRFAGKLDNEAGYQFAKEEGMRAVDNSASARGGIGGAALKAGARFAEGNANQFYNDSFNRWNTENTGIYNRLSNAAGLGQQANALVGASGQNYANQVGNTTNSLGNAQGAAAMNQGNIYGNLLNQGAAFGNRNNWWQG